MTNEQPVTPVNTVAEKKKPNLNKLTTIGLFCFQALFFLCFLLGSFSTENETVSLLGAVDKITRIFSWHSSLWYYYLSSFAEGVTYFIVGISLAKSFSEACRYAFGKDETHRLGVVAEDLHKTYKTLAVYLVVLRCLNESVIGGMATFLLILGLLVFVGEKALRIYCSHENPSWQHVTSECCYLFFKGLLLFTLGGLLDRAIVPQIIGGFSALFTAVDFSNGIVGLYTVYQLIVTAIFEIVLLCNLFVLVDETLCETEKSQSDYYSDEHLYWRRTLIVSLVYLAVDFVLCLALSNGGNGQIAETLSDYIYVASELVLPVALLCLTGLLASGFKRFPVQKETPALQPAVQTNNVQNS